MDTLPIPLDALDALGARPGGLDDFRIASAREILATLRQLQEGNVRLHLNGGNRQNGNSGHSLPVTVWSVDDDHIGFSIDIDVGPTDASLTALLEGDDVVAVGCIESVKLQFEAHAMVLVHGARASVLRCARPHEIFRFQRRGAFRVRPLSRSEPIARLRHSAPLHATQATLPAAGTGLALRVLDVSIGGCALLLPINVPANLPPTTAGSVIRQVEITLDGDTRFHIDLRVQHATELNVEAGGMRLGCEFLNADATTSRALQRFIDQSQQRSRLLANA